MGRTVSQLTTDGATRNGPPRVGPDRGRDQTVVPAGAPPRSVAVTTDLPALREDGSNDRRIEP